MLPGKAEIHPGLKDIQQGKKLDRKIGVFSTPTNFESMKIFILNCEQGTE
jgi:hypothetical protein